MKKNIIQLSISLLCSSMLLVGCGGSSDSSSVDNSNNNGNPVTPPNPTPPVPVPPQTNLNNKDTKVYVDVEDGVSLTANNLYVVANVNDPTSIKLANDYIALRNIPKTNLLSVSLPVKSEITAEEALTLNTAITGASNAKGFALAWTVPNNVAGNQSITSYVADGPTNVDFVEGCNVTPMSTYFDSGVSIGKPTGFRTSTVKPAMLLATYTGRTVTSVADPLEMTSEAKMTQYLKGIKETINNGIKSDRANYEGTAYYLKPSFNNLNIRYVDMQDAANDYQKYIKSVYQEREKLDGKQDILIYQTGLPSPSPSEFGSNIYLPGSLADSLTMLSGRIEHSPDVTVLDFLEAGATASFGTVRNPCAILEKFPKSSVLVKHYLSGDTLLEAYSKSVAAPTEGLFVGEPLARPYSRIVASVLDGQVYLENRGGVDGTYKITYKDKVISNGIYLKQGEKKVSVGTFIVPEGENPILKAVLQ